MELVRFTSHRGYSARRIFLSAMTVLVTALLLTASLSSTTQAATPGADWKGESILYDGKQYFPMADAVAGDSHGLAAGTKYYVATDEATSTGSNASRKAYIIYFSPGTDPPTATAAQYATYDLSSTDEYSNRQSQADITIKPQGESNQYSSCTVEGIGWIICPVSIFLAQGMDWLFGVLSGFVAVQPLIVDDTNSPLHIAWSVMRTFANVAFIALFLIIIYSQLTSWGLSNYGLKRLLPRMIVAAILVNLSFYISALAVDISNVLGYGLQDILNQIRESTFAVGDDTYSAETASWATVTGAVLSGGAVGAAWIGLGGNFAGAIYLVIPLLIGLLLTIVFVLLILAARQAIIIILIVISPLAFVANLLPNTEKWFDKWRDLFMSMLIFFPAFSLVFGGSQLAAGIIIQNANGPYGFVMMIFGLAVQVAPLIITPLILKLSGGLLGRIAQIANDPRKGLLDRSKNWSRDRYNMQKAKTNANTKPGFGGWASGRRVAQLMDNNARRVKDRTAMYEKQGENRYMNSKKYEDLYDQQHETETDRKITDSRLERNLYRKTASDPHHYQKALTADTYSREAANAKEDLTATLEEARGAGRGITYGPQSRDMTELVQRAQNAAKDTTAVKARMQNAETTTQQLVAESLNVKLAADNSNLAEFQESQALLVKAGGVRGTAGVTRARSMATAALTKMNNEALDNNKGLIEFEALQSGMTGKDYSRKMVIDMATSNDPTVRASVTADQIEAAYEIQAADGQVGLLEAARGSTAIDQSILDRVFARNAGTLKGKGGFHLQADPSLSLQRYLDSLTPGTVNYGSYGTTEADVIRRFNQDMSISRVESLSNTPADKLGEMKYGAFVDTANNFDDVFLPAMDLDNPLLSPKVRENRLATLRKIHNAVQVALTDDGIYGSMTDRLEEARLIDSKLSGIFGEDPVPRRSKERVTPPGEAPLPETGDYYTGGDSTSEHPGDGGDSDSGDKS